MSHSAATAAHGPLSQRDIALIMTGIVLSMILGALDQTIVATALPTIGLDLKDIEHLAWVVTSYLLATTAVTPLYGKLADIRGRRVTMMLAIIVFLLGSVACALSRNMTMLILARALQGLGGGGLMALGQTIIADIIPPKERPKYQAYIATVYASSSVIGPVLGGFFAEHLHWSVIFWINLPIGLAALLMTNTVLRKLPRHDRPHRLDILGSVLLVIATVLLLLALNWGGQRYAWASPPILSLLAGSILVWALFALRILSTDEPLVPISLLRNGVVRNATLAAFFGMGTFMGLAIYIPIFFETVLKLGASLSGLALIPFMIGTVVGATYTGRMMVRVTRYKRITYVGLSVTIAMCLAITQIIGQVSAPVVIMLLCVMSLCGGTLFPITTVAVQNAVLPHEMGTATGLMNFLRALGGAFIVALYGTILFSVAGSGGEGVSVSTLSNPENATNLALAFKLIFAASTAGYVLALIFFALVEELPWRTRNEAPAATAVEH